MAWNDKVKQSNAYQDKAKENKTKQKNIVQHRMAWKA